MQERRTNEKLKLVGYTVSSSGVSIGKECTHAHKTKHTGKMSTCIEHGINDYYICDDCKAVLKADGKTVTTLENETLPLIDHSFGKLVSEVPASCVAEGMKAYYTCSVCGAYFDENKEPIAYTDLVIFKTPHQMGEKWYADGNEHWYECVSCGQKMMSEKHTLSGKEASCVESIYCTVCGYIVTPKTGHTDENKDKICDTCGASWQELPEISAAQSTLSYKKGTDGNISVFVKNLGENDLRFIKLNDSTLSMNDYDVTVTKDGAMITIKGEALDELSSGDVNVFISTVFGDLEAKGTIERADKPESSADIVIPKKDSVKDDGKKSPAVIIAAAAVVAAAGVFVLIKKKKSDN